ncbi:MAG: hypothetical protein J2P43_00075 [Candidatus Dormibacteraeota bacterium]|nr:hypothetical protein [Candidatus Dormibacteraeota bacterium]MBO0743386.1 hypothetical protein [Candidatus Dormibacteraeota bacterium]
MNWSFARKEWGAISFVLAVIVGVIAVPVALIFHNDSNRGVALNQPAPITTPATTPTGSPGASSPTASPSPGG